MIALVLVHEGLDVSIDLDLREPGSGSGGTVGHRGGDRLVVTARADRAALEWALRLTDRVVVLTVSPQGSEDVLAWALGRGAGQAVRIWDDALEVLDLGSTARIVTAAVRRIAPAIVLAGERGLAGSTGALPALVAAHLGWPSVDGAIRLARVDEDELVVERRLQGGRREELALPWPGVVTVAADSAEPRYVSIRARRDAARRGHETWSLADLGLTESVVRAAVKVRVDRVDWPRPRPRRAATAPPAGPARSAADRLRQLVGGGRPGAGPSAPAAPPASGVVEGDPRAVADRIMAFLEQRGFV